jgi:hypothetical protein
LATQVPIARADDGLNNMSNDFRDSAVDGVAAITSARFQVTLVAIAPQPTENATVLGSNGLTPPRHSEKVTRVPD